MKQSTQKLIDSLRRKIKGIEKQLENENSQLVDSEEYDAVLCRDNEKFYGAKIDALEAEIFELEAGNNF